MSITLKDIVKKTGLSMSTVSHVLNGRPGFSASTQQRVHQVARELGYLPNHLSRALAGGKSMSIGLMGETFKTPIRLLRMREIEKLAKADSYCMYLVANEGMMAEPDMLKTVEDMLARRVDGLIICDLNELPSDVTQRLLNCGKPVVFVDHVPDQATHGVHMDRTAALSQAVKHLHDLGHDSAVYLGSRFDQLVPELKLGRYRQELKMSGMQLIEPEHWYVEATGLEDMSDAAYALTQQMLKHIIPSAIICISDETAIGAIHAIEEAGLSVPDDVSVIGFDDLPIAKHFKPSLTTISQPMLQAGQAAYEILSNLFKASDASPEIRELRCQFIARESTGPVRSNAPTAKSLYENLATHKPVHVQS
ncbi:MAG TPA: hypothetical protein DCM28_00510 [Phycisphaerales bacterium]|nr:hypothetical protein [Phycisphaerales bacterium]HCD31168.1 hypothetical protein [Phycisphaerales bacterium]|tara:strand:- start:1467 stop:2558 length:1092 start_codon:yes stop_codon:yes gene_type:complete